MAVMARYPDKWFDLAVVDPPYGIGQNKNNGKSIGLRKKWSGYIKQKYKSKEWDSEPPSAEYFIELYRISKNQIIWGSNYFELKPTKGIIAWDKQCDGTGFSHFELAWSSFDKSAKIFRYPIQGESQERIHPTQKPVALYDWLLKNYAKPGDKILDTHLGSASSRIAADRAGLDFVGCEIDKEYYNDGVKRYNNYKAQLTLW